jgi:hypothetical protein
MDGVIKGFLDDGIISNGDSGKDSEDTLQTIIKAHKGQSYITSSSVSDAEQDPAIATAIRLKRKSTARTLKRDTAQGSMPSDELDKSFKDNILNNADTEDDAATREIIEQYGLGK